MRSLVRLFAALVGLLSGRFVSSAGLGALGRRRWRDAVFAARADHARQCRQSGPRLGISHRRSRSPRARADEAHQVSGDAVAGRGQPDLLLALQRSDRARSRHRRAEMALRSQDLDRASDRPTATIAAASPIGSIARPLRAPPAARASSWAPTTSASSRSTRAPAFPAPISAAWRDQARDRRAAGMAGRIPDHVGAGGQPRRRHRRLLDCG